MTMPLAVTLGDPAGIGPEITVRAIEAVGPEDFIVIGQRSVVEQALSLVGSKLTIQELAGRNSEPRPGKLRLYSTGNAVAQTHPVGVESAEAGAASFDAVRAAIDLANSCAVAGIVTAPINKASLALAGVNFPGHTEILAEFSGANDVCMMLMNEDIRTVLVTIHCSMRSAVDAIDIPLQLKAIRAAHAGARSFGLTAPRVAVAGLNPHAGENGLFGTEESEIIKPAIEIARAEGIDATGPWPGDTVFMQARTGRFDVVVAQYHDQGLIPVKYLGLETGVNVTLGLPFVRTSPDHGTAFDIAGRGIADARSMIAALRAARDLAEFKRKERARWTSSSC